MQLQVPRKAFTTVDQLCYHLELCSMMTIIADTAKQGGRAGAGRSCMAAGRESDHHLHVQHMPTLTLGHHQHYDTGTMPSRECLQGTRSCTPSNHHSLHWPEEIQRNQLRLGEGCFCFAGQHCETPTGASCAANQVWLRYAGGGRGSGRGGGRCCGSRGGAVGCSGRHQSHCPLMRACTICCMHHPGDPPEDHCYKCDVKVAREALDTLQAEQRAAAARAKDRAEQK
eukprot:3792008-Rhodomonas_salina.1